MEINELEKLRRENETLKALLFLNNLKVEFDARCLENDSKLVVSKELVEASVKVAEVKTLLLLLRADAIVLKESVNTMYSDLRKQLFE